MRKAEAERTPGSPSGEENESASKNEHPPHLPVSGHESPDFLRAANWGIFWSFLGYFVIAYGLTAVLIAHSEFGRAFAGHLIVAAEHMGISAVGTRFEDLTTLDGVSGYAYVSSVLVGIGGGIAFASWNIWHYARLVLKPARFTPIDRRAWRGWLANAAFAAFIVWVVGFANPRLADNPYPGMGAIFIWPLSPAPGYGITFALGLFLFVTVSGVWKVILQVRS